MFTDPVKNLKSFGIREDMIVADLGAGTGFYSLLLSEMLPLGKVYAVEIERDFLKTISNSAYEKKCTNLECLLGDVERLGGTKIGNNILDAVIASNILFQVEDKSQFVKEMKRILKPKGKVLLVDWLPDSQMLNKTTHKLIPKDKAKKILEENGFKFDRDIPAGDYHYGMIFIKH